MLKEIIVSQKIIQNKSGKIFSKDNLFDSFIELVFFVIHNYDIQLFAFIFSLNHFILI